MKSVFFCCATKRVRWLAVESLHVALLTRRLSIHRTIPEKSVKLITGNGFPVVTARNPVVGAPTWSILPRGGNPRRGLAACTSCYESSQPWVSRFPIFYASTCPGRSCPTAHRFRVWSSHFGTSIYRLLFIGGVKRKLAWLDLGKITVANPCRKSANRFVAQYILPSSQTPCILWISWNNLIFKTKN